MTSISLWAAVPHYVAQPPCPKATLALVRRIEDILDIPVPLGDLVEEARAWEIGVDELAAEDDEVARVRQAARGGARRDRPARGERRGHRPGVRALPAAPGRRGPLAQALVERDRRVRRRVEGRRRRSRCRSPRMPIATFLPSSTPHWSNESIPHTDPCTKVLCSYSATRAPSVNGVEPLHHQHAHRPVAGHHLVRARDPAAVPSAATSAARAAAAPGRRPARARSRRACPAGRRAGCRCGPRR